MLTQADSLLENTKQQVEAILKMKQLTDKQKKNLDKTGDGKLTEKDFLLVRMLKNKRKNGKAKS